MVIVAVMVVSSSRVVKMQVEHGEGGAEGGATKRRIAHTTIIISDYDYVAQRESVYSTSLMMFLNYKKVEQEDI